MRRRGRTMISNCGVDPGKVWIRASRPTCRGRAYGMKINAQRFITMISKLGYPWYRRAGDNWVQIKDRNRYAVRVEEEEVVVVKQLPLLRAPSGTTAFYVRLAPIQHRSGIRMRTTVGMGNLRLAGWFSNKDGGGGKYYSVGFESRYDRGISMFQVVATGTRRVFRSDSPGAQTPVELAKA